MTAELIELGTLRPLHAACQRGVTRQESGLYLVLSSAD
jgi:hypothetical protein